MYKDEGEYVFRGQYEMDDDKRITWDYFKIVEEARDLGLEACKVCGVMF